jgi:hypothetical protein
MTDFDQYKSVGAVGSSLGKFIEIGAGPWTQSLWMIKKRQVGSLRVQASAASVVDPW